MTIATEPRYHVPRSQVWAGSRGRQSGNVHLHVTDDVTIGRLARRKGASLCGKRGWYEREPTAGEETCPRCLDIAHRYGFHKEDRPA